MAVNSYDPKAKTPAVGTRWVWEIDNPGARELVEVTEVKWNGEEWFVKTVGLLRCLPSALGGGEHWGDLSRFCEAVTPVGGTPRGAWVSRPAVASGDDR